MAGITLEIAEARLTAYLDAEAAVLTGQAYEMDTGGGRRKLTRADLPGIQEGIRTWEGRVQRLSRTGGLMVREVIPK